MAIITRLSRLLVSDMHSVIERMEEPELLLKQSIREMEEALQAQQVRLQREEAQLRRLRRRSEELTTRITELDAQLDASIEAQRMDTARSIVRRKLEAESTHGDVTLRIEALEDGAHRLGKEIARQSAELSALREKAQLMCEHGDAEAGEPPRTSSAWFDDQDVEAALLREMERRSAS